MLAVMKKLFNKIAIEHATFKYRISSHTNDTYRLQVVGKSSYCELTAAEIVNDEEIINNLHPVQSCFIAMEFLDSYKNKKNKPKIPPHRRMEKPDIKLSLSAMERGGIAIIYDEDYKTTSPL